MRVPAVCDKCGTIFPSGFEVKDSTNISFSGCGSGPCPKCGGNSHIPDGVYNFIGNTIELLSGPSRTISELERLSSALKKAREQRASLEQVSTTIQKEFPELLSLNDILPKSRSELYAFIAIILTIIGLILGQIKKSEPTKIEINQVVNVIYQSQTDVKAAIESKPSTRDQSNRNLEKQKIGRNDPCPCGSGKKFKKCCLDK